MRWNALGWFLLGAVGTFLGLWWWAAHPLLFR